MKLAFEKPVRTRKSKQNFKCTLQSAGWRKPARRTLETLIQKGAGLNLPAVFDFDNTIISGDVGEAVLAMLAGAGRLAPGTIDPKLGPAVPVPGKGTVSVESCSDVMEYYEALLNPTVHGQSDPKPLDNGYVWATQALEGLSVAEILAATSTVFRIGERSQQSFVQASEGGQRYPSPRFYQPIAELMAQLLQLRYQVWIVSASNVWSVRWMIIHGLNPLLRKYGARSGLPPERVIGMATLLKDRNGKLYKDSVLVRENSAYAALGEKTMKSLQITPHLEHPVPVYCGKVACILDFIGANPYLCAGDSPSDHPMLRVSRHRLWIARREKPQAQRMTRALMRRTGTAGWVVQPAFVTDRSIRDGV
jgi:hypothetical protein